MEVHFDYFKINRLFKKQIDKNFEELYNLKSDSDIYYYKKNVETQFTSYLGCKNTYFTDSGTSAFDLIIKNLNFDKDTEIIVPAVAYQSILLPIYYNNLKPIFIDIKSNFTIDESKIEQKITNKTKAIIAVHLFGYGCNIKKLRLICEKYNLLLIEDACQAHGSTYKNKYLGTFGDINFFSFTYHKTISSAGGGGAIIFNDKSKYLEFENMTKLEKDNKSLLTSKRAPSRISIADLPVLKFKLSISKVLEDGKIISQRIFEDNLKDLNGVELVFDDNDYISVRQMFVCYVKNRDKLIEFLKKEGIETKLPYKPFYNYNIFKNKELFVNYPLSQKYEKEAIFIPMYSMMTKEEILFITNKIKLFYS